jgi:predicted transposase YbfD/YdcC
MDVSTTRKLTRIEQCQANAKKRSEQKRQATLSALAHLKLEKRTITKAAVACQAGVSLVFLRSHPDLMQAIEEAASTRSSLVSVASPGSLASDQVIAALRRRLEEMKQQLTAKDQQLHRKQREIDLLYGKLAAASPLTDAELRSAYGSALERLLQQDLHPEP